MDKPWYTSKTILGAIIAFAAFIGAQTFGYSIISSQEASDLIDSIIKVADGIAGLIGIILVIYGRVKAGKEIKNLRAQVKRLNA